MIIFHTNLIIVKNVVLNLDDWLLNTNRRKMNTDAAIVWISEKIFILKFG